MDRLLDCLTGGEPPCVAGFLILIALVAANLPWLSERVLFVLPPRGGRKGIGVRLMEWLLLYFLTLGIGFGLERKLTAAVHDQDWEFYVVTLALFAVFALPGFIWRYDLRHSLRER